MRSAASTAGVFAVLVVIACLAVVVYHQDARVNALSQANEYVANDCHTIQTQLQEAGHPSIRDRVINLPEDGKQFHLAMVVLDDYSARPADRMLRHYFHTNLRLRSLQGQTKSHYYLPKSVPARIVQMGNARIEQTPMVRLQTGEGQVIYQATGSAVPLDVTGDALADELQAAIEAYKRGCPWRPCPRPNPPAPPDPPQPDLQPVIPDMRPPDVDVDVDVAVDPPFPWGLLIGIVIVCGAASLIYQFRKERTAS